MGKALSNDAVDITRQLETTMKEKGMDNERIIPVGALA